MAEGTKSGVPPLQGAFLVGGTVLIVAGWWYARNVLLYGDLFGTENLLNVSGLRVKPITWQGMIGELQGLKMSFWGVFGWFSILLPSWIYSLLDLMIVLAATGGVIVWLRSSQVVVGEANGLKEHAKVVKGIALTWSIISCALLAYWILGARSSQGRLLFPAISALAVVAVTGLRFWAGLLPRVVRIGLGLVVPLGLWICSLYTLTELLPDAYGLDAKDKVVEELPGDARPIGKVYGDGINLVGVRLPEGRVSADDPVPITFYWLSDRPQDTDYEMFVQLLDHQNRQMANVTGHPGWGTWPLSLWRPGELYEDRYQLEVTDLFEYKSPVLARVYVGFLEEGLDRLLPVEEGDLSLESRVVATVEIDAFSPKPNEMQDALVTFGSIVLQGIYFPDEVSLPGVLPVMLHFRAVSQPEEDLTVFVHVNAPDGTFIAGYDQPSAEGRFPTSRWRVDDTSLGTWPVKLSSSLPPGRYEVWVGLYGTDGVRIPPIDLEGRDVLHDRILLGTFDGISATSK